ncbi:conserved hypothetical protein [Trichinella spiralis]|uniref:hypothetical protein n=1 Tax=Trichinella spiralis TaxID=6334 RepID=UPI0001EFC555|nr:conserved hypothetical protein [Trichinella spiralis]
MRDQNQYLPLATKIGTHLDLLGESQFADTSFLCLPGSQFRTDESKAVSQSDQVAISVQGRGRGSEMFHPVQPSRRRQKIYVRVHLIVLLVFNKGFPLGHCIRWELPPQSWQNNLTSFLRAFSSRKCSVRHGVSSTLQLLHLNRLSHSSSSAHGSPPRPVVNRIGSSAFVLLPSSSQRKSHTFDCLQRWTGQISSQVDELRDAVQTLPPVYTRFVIQNELNCRMPSPNFSMGKLRGGGRVCLKLIQELHNGIPQTLLSNLLMSFSCLYLHLSRNTRYGKRFELNVARLSIENRQQCKQIDSSDNNTQPNVRRNSA